MISRRIGPISPARTRPERSDGADDSFAVSLDPIGLGSSQRTFGIGITPEHECQHERAARRPRRQELILIDRGRQAPPLGHGSGAERGGLPADGEELE
jgi:hypothetical protein